MINPISFKYGDMVCICPIKFLKVNHRTNLSWADLPPSITYESIGKIESIHPPTDTPFNHMKLGDWAMVRFPNHNTPARLYLNELSFVE